MSCNLSLVLVLLVSPIFFYLRCVSTESIPVSSFLIDCGSLTNTTIDKRLFTADIETPQSTFVTTNTTSSNSSYYYSKLYNTARVFNETSHYSFRIPRQGRHWIRLHFAPFGNLTEAKFSVSAQNRTLLKDYQSERQRPQTEVLLLKEYSLNVTSDTLVLTFAPFPGSFSFASAVEVVPLPDRLVPESAGIAGSPGARRSLDGEAMETFLRVNMGNVSVSPEDDGLRRSWVGDGRFLRTRNTAVVSNIDAVKFGSSEDEDAAPREVYGTATRLDVDVAGVQIFANLTWRFDGLSPGLEYFVRFHFCDIAAPDERVPPAQSPNPSFNVYADSLLAASHRQERDDRGAPYFLDSVVRLTAGSLTVSVGPDSWDDSHMALLVNGLEIVKLVDSGERLDHPVPRKSSARRTVVLALAAAGIFLLCSASAAALSLLLCRRRRRKPAAVGNSRDTAAAAAAGVVVAEANNNNNNNGVGAAAQFFPLAAVREATDDFSESLVIGAGGFGKVYKGILTESGTAVAIKRGAPHSAQGMAEFRTEIEMLSQFRHRHLVTLIGYCDEKGELIIIYEYMENLTLKEHLYGSGLKKLSWGERVRILIGSARGLHYLHTGTAKPVIHRDVKSANILLDRDLAAKVADFGLSKAGPGPETGKAHVSTAVKGSFGYLDPEYLTTQRLTEKSDVYSFGVVMLESLCGRAVVDPSLPREEASLVDWAKRRCRGEPGRAEEIADPCLAGQARPESVAKFWEIAEKCLALEGGSRPSMGDVLWNLERVLRLQGDEREISSSSSSSPAMIIADDRCEAEGIAAVDLGDLAGVSMSKVFAQMVRM